RQRSRTATQRVSRVLEAGGVTELRESSERTRCSHRSRRTQGHGPARAREAARVEEPGGGASADGRQPALTKLSGARCLASAKARPRARALAPRPPGEPPFRAGEPPLRAGEPPLRAGEPPL